MTSTPRVRRRMRTTLALARSTTLLGSCFLAAPVLRAQPATPDAAPAVPPSAAAPAAPAAAASAPAATELRNVVVSGSAERERDELVERRSRSGALFGDSDLREVPFTVNVITSTEIANKQARTLGQALAGDPAVRNDYGGTGAYPTESFNIHGFSINSNGMLKDGMPMANQVTQAVENVDQVEVIRGPMGFRYGFVSPGGAINLVSKRPTTENLRSLTLSTDEYGTAQGHLDLGGRAGVDDRFGYRINAVLGEQHNFVRPVNIRRKLLAGSFDFRLTPDTTVNLTADTYLWNQGPESFHYTVPDVNGNELRGIPPDQYFGQKSLKGPDFRTSTATLGLDSKLSDKLKLTSVFGVYDWKAAYSITTPSNAQPNGDFTVFASKGDYKTRNLTNTTFLNLQADTWGLAHSVTGGFTYTRSKGWNRQNRGGGVLGTPDGAGGVTPFVNNFYRPVQFPDTTPDPSGPYVRSTDTYERGLFVSDEIRIGEAWRVLLALRRSSINEQGLYSPGANTSTDPTLGAMYQLSDAVSVYASWATGLEMGGIAPQTARNAYAAMPAQKTRQVEVGVKSDLAHGLTVDAALFRISKASEFVNADNVYVQSGRQLHTGAEVRLIGRVTPAINLSTGVQWLKAELTGDPATEGQRPQNVPRLNVSFSGEWKLAAVEGLTLTGAIYHAGEREISVPAIPAKAAAYTRLDLGGRYETRIGGQEAVLRLGVENVTDKAYYSVGWYSLYEYGTPRTVSGSVEFRF